MLVLGADTEAQGMLESTEPEAEQPSAPKGRADQTVESVKKLKGLLGF